MLSILGAQVTSVESLDYLMSLKGQYDFFMATVPVSKMGMRDTYLSRFVQFPAQKRILWYSGPEPLRNIQACRNISIHKRVCR